MAYSRRDLNKGGEQRLSATTRAFLSEVKEARQGYLDLRKPEEREIIFEEWVRTPGFRLMDMFDPDLSDDTFFRIERHLNGNSKLNMSSPRKMFYVKPNPDFTPAWDGAPDNYAPSIEVEMRHNKREFLYINEPMELPSDLAITAMASYGPTGKFSHLRGALVEIERDEYIAHEAQKREAAQAAEDAEIADNMARAQASQADAMGHVPPPAPPLPEHPPTDTEAPNEKPAKSNSKSRRSNR